MKMFLLTQVALGILKIAVLAETEYFLWEISISVIWAINQQNLFESVQESWI